MIILNRRRSRIVGTSFLLDSQFFYNIYRSNAVFNGTYETVGISSFGSVSLWTWTIGNNLHKIVFLDLNLAITSMSVCHWLLAGWCHLIFHEVALTRSLRAFQLVTDLSDTFISQLEDSFLCRTTVIAVKASIYRAIFCTKVSHVVKTRHGGRWAVMDTTILCRLVWLEQRLHIVLNRRLQ